MIDDLTTFKYSHFGNITGIFEPFACVKTENGLIITNGGNGTINLFDNADNVDNLITTIKSGYPRRVYRIIEIFTGIIITAEIDRCYIHNITSIHLDDHPVITIIANLQTVMFEYREIISLRMGGSGYFALGGSYNNNGMVQICELHANLTITIHKEIKNISSTNCNISVIREITDGKIYIGGHENDNCKMACTWEYIQDPQPICYNLSTNTDYDILDIVSVCAD